MSNAIQLTAAAKKTITENWQSALPSLGVYRPMWLLKRHGPLLVGVILERTRSNDVYIPKFHVHNLLAQSSAILLSLFYPVPDQRQPKLNRQIKVSKHTEEYLTAVAFLKQATPELEIGQLDWPHIVSLHCAFIKEKRDYAVAKFCSSIFQDVILLAHWCGHVAYAEQCLGEAVRLMRNWTPQVDVIGWQKSIELLTPRETMQQTLKAELVKHKLQHIPTYELQADGVAPSSVTQIYEAAWL